MKNKTRHFRKLTAGIIAVQLLFCSNAFALNNRDRLIATEPTSNSSVDLDAALAKIELKVFGKISTGLSIRVYSESDSQMCFSGARNVFR